MAQKSDINKNVWVLLIMAWIAMASSQVITFSYGMMLPDIMEEFSLSYQTSGLISGLAAFASVITTIPITLVAVRFNPKVSIPVVIVLMAIGFAIFGFAANVPMLFFGRILAAAFNQTIATTLVIVKMRAVPSDRMQQVNGIENFVGPIGQTVATLVMAQILVLIGGWRNVYLTIAAIMIVAAILWFANYGKSAALSAPAAAPAAGAAPAPGAEVKNPLLQAMKNKTIWLTALAWPGTTIVWIAMFYYWPSYAMGALNITREQAGFCLAFIPIFSAIASLTGPILAKKLGYDKPLIVMWGIILPLAYFMMLNTSNLVILCACTAVAGYGAYAWVPLAFTNVYKLGLPQKVVSMGTSMILSFVSLGSALGSSIVGGLIERFGLYQALAICCLTPLWFLLLTLFLPELGRKKMEALAAQRAAAAAK